MSAPRPDSRSHTVLCISTYFPEHGGGVERVAHDIAQYFSKSENWHVVVAAHETDAPASSGAGDYHRLGMRCWNGIERAVGLPLVLPHPMDLVRVLRRVRTAQIVVVHEEIYIANFIAILWAWICSVPLIVVKHTGRVPLKNRFLKLFLAGVTRLVARPLLKRADRTVFVTKAKRVNYDPDGVLANATVVANGIDTDLFTLPAEGSSEREGVVFVGRFVESKGMSVLRRIAAALPEVPFRLVGWGPEDPKLWKLANVTVIDKPDRHVIASQLRQSLMLLVPSAAEGLPLVALEAMASGTRTLVRKGTVGVDATLEQNLIFLETDLDAVEKTSRVWTNAIRDALQIEDSLEAQRSRRDAVCQKNSISAMGSAYAMMVRDVLGLQDGTDGHETDVHLHG